VRNPCPNPRDGLLNATSVSIGDIQESGMIPGFRYKSAPDYRWFREEPGYEHLLMPELAGEDWSEWSIVALSPEATQAAYALGMKVVMVSWESPYHPVTTPTTRGEDVVFDLSAYSWGEMEEIRDGAIQKGLPLEEADDPYVFTVRVEPSTFIAFAIKRGDIFTLFRYFGLASRMDHRNPTLDYGTLPPGLGYGEYQSHGRTYWAHPDMLAGESRGGEYVDVLRRDRWDETKAPDSGSINTGEADYMRDAEFLEGGGPPRIEDEMRTNSSGRRNPTDERIRRLGRAAEVDPSARPAWWAVRQRAGGRDGFLAVEEELEWLRGAEAARIRAAHDERISSILIAEEAALRALHPRIRRSRRRDRLSLEGWAEEVAPEEARRVISEFRGQREVCDARLSDELDELWDRASELEDALALLSWQADVVRSDGMIEYRRIYTSTHRIVGYPAGMYARKAAEDDTAFLLTQSVRSAVESEPGEPWPPDGPPRIPGAGRGVGSHEWIRPREGYRVLAGVESDLDGRILRVRQQDWQRRDWDDYHEKIRRSAADEARGNPSDSRLRKLERLAMAGDRRARTKLDLEVTRRTGWFPTHVLHLGDDTQVEVRLPSGRGEAFTREDWVSGSVGSFVREDLVSGIGRYRLGGRGLQGDRVTSSRRIESGHHYCALCWDLIPVDRAVTLSPGEVADMGSPPGAVMHSCAPCHKMGWGG